jgi:hypothetical protein
LLCGSVTTAIDSTGVGDPNVEELQGGADNYVGAKDEGKPDDCVMALALAVEIFVRRLTRKLHKSRGR